MIGQTVTSCCTSMSGLYSYTKTEIVESKKDMLNHGHKSKFEQNMYTLSESELDSIVLQTQHYAKNVKIDDSSANRYAFLVDNVLYYWLMHGGAGKELTVTYGKKLMTPYVMLELEGEKIDPNSLKTVDYGMGGNDIIIMTGQLPEYEYRDGVNIVTVRLKRERSLIREICFVSVAAVAVGILGNVLLPEATRNLLLSSVIGPVIDMFFDLLRCIAGPMVFLSVVWGICGIGDSRLFGQVGKSVLLYSVCITALGAVIGAGSFAFLGNGFSDDSLMGSNLNSLLEMILGIVPSSIVDPFSTGNTLQIIFLAIAMGMALITMSAKVGRLIIAIDQINMVVQYLMSFITRLVPFIVFLLMTNMIWTDSWRLLFSMWKFFAALLVAFVVIAGVVCLYTALHQKVNFIHIAKKNLSSFVVALTTASSAAAFSNNLKAAKEKYGISADFSGFSIPLGMIVHNPIAACYNIVLVIYFASAYGVSCSVGWLIIGIVVSTVVAISSPPIPGGAAVSYALLFTQMGIPEEALAVVLILDVITDFIVTSFECYVLPISLVNIAGRLNRLDIDVLKKK